MEQTALLNNLAHTDFGHLGHHQRGISRLNIGSFRSCPASVLAAQTAWQKLWLQQPDAFYYGPLQDGLHKSCAAIASIINAHSKDVCLVDNVTTAAAIVAQDIAWGFSEGRFRKGDRLNCTYAIRKCFQCYVVRAGATIIEVELRLPVHSSEEILLRFQEVLKKARTSSHTIRLAVIDHVTSMPSVLLPVKDLVKLCRSEGIEQIFVDGSHAIGNVDIDVQDIDADYYTSNLHRWLFAPPTVAFFHCKQEHLNRLHHPIVSHNYGTGLFDESSSIGTRDYSAQLAVTAAAVDFVTVTLGGLHVLQNLNHESVVHMGNMLAEFWGTHCGTSPELCSSMVMVALPDELTIHSHEDAHKLRTRLREKFKIEAPICYQSGCPTGFDISSSFSETQCKDTAYVRISHQIYSRAEEYVTLKDAILSIVQDILQPADTERKSGEHVEYVHVVPS